MKQKILGIALLALCLPIRAAQPDDTYPEPVAEKDVAISWNRDNNSFDITFKVPEKGSTYNDDFDIVPVELENITSVSVFRLEGYFSESLVKTFNNPTPGETLSCTDTGVTKGEKYNYRFYVLIGENEEYSDIRGLFAGCLPAAISDFAVSTTNGGLPISIDVAVPDRTADGRYALESIDRIELYQKGSWGASDKIYASAANPVPGSKTTLTVNDATLANGTYYWQLRVFAADGVSADTPCTFMLGKDRPGVVTDIKIIETSSDKVEISWKAPEKGAQNGFFDPENLKYTLLCSTNGASQQIIAENISETIFTYTHGMSDPATLAISVKASSTGGTGDEATAPKIIVGPAQTLPYTEGFDTKDDKNNSLSDNLWVFGTTSTSRYPRTWAVATQTYVGSAKVSPYGGSAGLAYIGYYSNPSEQTTDLMTSGKIDVDGQEWIEVSYNYYACADGTNSTVGLAVSFDGSEFTTLHSANMADLKDAGWKGFTQTIAVPAGAKSARLRYFACNGSNPSTVIVDNVCLKAADAVKVIYPASVSDLTASYNATTDAVDISFKAPSLSHAVLGDIHGEALDHISSIAILRSINGEVFSLITTIENPAPGAELTYSDTATSLGGSYSYQIVCTVDGRSDEGKTLATAVKVGQKPAAATELRAMSNKGTAPVTLGFLTPDKDATGNVLSDKLFITIERAISPAFEWQAVQENAEYAPGTMCNYTDATVEQGYAYEYRIITTARAGSSTSQSVTVLVDHDAPGYVSDVVAVADDNGRVRLSWKAPEGGLYNGYVDLEHLTYDIYYGNPYNEYSVRQAALGIDGLTYTDTKRYPEETTLFYYVRANAGSLSGYAKASNTITVGAPAKLPFVEDFDTADGDYVQPSRSTWTIGSTMEKSNWAFAALAYFIMEGQVRPFGNSGGLAYCYYTPFKSDEREDWLTTGRIDFSTVENPVLSFQLYGVPGYDTKVVVELGDENDNFATLKTIDYAELTATGWQEIAIPIDNKGTGRIRFRAVNGMASCSVAIDHVEIKHTSALATIDTSDITIKVIEGGVEIAGNKSMLSIYNAQGMEVAAVKGDGVIALAPGIYIANGQKFIVR